MHDTLFWRHGERWAVRRGDFKLVRQNPKQAPMRSDLRQDLGERNDLAAEMPTEVAQLHELVTTWMQGLAAPRW